MTLKEIRTEVKNKIKRYTEMGELEWVNDVKYISNVFEELYKEGTIVHFLVEVLRIANHFAIIEEDVTVLQTYDLHRIIATKKAAKEMYSMWLFG